MAEPMDRLLDELSSEDEGVRQTAVGRARALSSENLQQLMHEYCSRRADQRGLAQPEPLPESLRKRLKQLFSGRLSQTHLPYLLELARLNGSLANVIAALDAPEAIGPVLTLLDIPAWSRLDSIMVGIASGIADFGDMGLLIRHATQQKMRCCPATDLELRMACESALERLLPRLRPEDASGWTPEQRRALLVPLAHAYLYYRPSPSPEGRPAWGSYMVRHQAQIHIPIRPSVRALKRTLAQTLAILKTLQQIGDERELALVRRLANIAPKTPMSREIQQVAEECLPFLELRAHQNRQNKMLLRPAETHFTVAADALLRPADVKIDNTSSEELLRPHKRQ